ncbi:hypothetical protein FB451DRAFT_1559417 [Mycena latifolia]|nr:hypothetical protein FB451DRAFT_1559417 [Mycena latifolia]
METAIVRFGFSASKASGSGKATKNSGNTSRGGCWVQVEAVGIVEGRRRSQEDSDTYIEYLTPSPRREVAKRQKSAGLVLKVSCGMELVAVGIVQGVRERGVSVIVSGGRRLVPCHTEHTAPNHGNVAVGHPYNRDANPRKRKLQILQASHTHHLAIRSSVVGRGRSEQTLTTVPRPTIGLEATALRTALEAPAVAGGIFSPVHGPSTELGPPGRQPESCRDPKSMMPSTEHSLASFALTCLVLLAVLWGAIKIPSSSHTPHVNYAALARLFNSATD